MLVSQSSRMHECPSKLSVHHTAVIPYKPTTTSLYRKHGYRRENEEYHLELNGCWRIMSKKTLVSLSELKFHPLTH